MSSAHWPDAVVARLIEVVHAAIVHVHVPREGGAAGGSSRRPVVVGLHVGERVSRWQRWIIIAQIQKTL